MATILIYLASSARTEEYARLLGGLVSGNRLIPCLTPEAAAAAALEAEILFAWKFPPELYPLAVRLRWVQSMGAGVEDLLAAPIPEHVVLTRVEGLFGSSMSEYALAHMLAHTQQLRRLYDAQRRGSWEPFFPDGLAGRRLGVAGAGSIGSAVATLGKAFGMEVWALTRAPRPIPCADRTFTPEGVAEFTAGVDFLVSTLPLTPETPGLIDPCRMKPGALLINMGRGRTIEEGAILEAVRSSRIQAVLDVFAGEPLPPDHPFWSTPGVTVTPHLSGLSVPADVAGYFAENLRRFEAGEPLAGLVDRKRGY